MSLFKESKEVLVKNLFNKPVRIEKVYLDDKGRGEYGIFLVQDMTTGEKLSFTLSAKAIMGLIYKYFASIGYRLTPREVIELPEPIDITLVQKTSREGRQYIDYENEG